MAGLGRTIRALPVRDLTAAVAHRSQPVGFTGSTSRTASYRIETEDIDGLQEPRQFCRGEP